MSLTGSSLYSSISNRSLIELPNLPGVKRDISVANPKLYKDFKRSQAALAAEKDNEQLLTDNHNHDNFDNQSIRSAVSFRSSADQSVLQEISKALNPFEHEGSQYNDLSGRYGLVSQKRDRLNKSMSLPFCSLDSVSSFVSGQKKPYKITAIYDEVTPENLLELFRTRKVEIICHGEDGTIEITEPKQKNVALVQGKVLKRHKVLKPPNRKRTLEPGAKPYFTVEDFYSGAEPIIYGRQYKVIDGDSATRRYYNDELGRDFGPALPLPASFYEPQTKQQLDALRSTHGGKSLDKNASVDQFGQLSKSYKAAAFFTYATKTLRFIGVWDNRTEMFGDKIFVKIHYTLKDHQIEVIPLVERNSGRDNMNVLLKKTTLLTRDSLLPQFNDIVNSHCDSIDASTITHSQPSGRLHTPSSDDIQKINPPRPYNWNDLYIGLNLTMASSKVTIIDADEFTREFYKSQGKPLDEPLRHLTVADLHPGVTKALESKNEDPNKAPGFLPLNPPKDGTKLKLYQGLILRYEAKLHNPKPADVSRVFILQIHLEDDSIQVREPPRRNTGHQGGIFLARDRFESKGLGRYLLPEDISIGSTIQIMAHKFDVFNADEYTLKYMEQNENRWIWSNVAMVLKKIAAKNEVVSRLMLATPDIQHAMLSYDEVFDLMKLASVDVIKQETLTICRFLDPSRSGQIKLSKLLKLLMDDKKR